MPETVFVTTVIMVLLVIGAVLRDVHTAHASVLVNGSIYGDEGVALRIDFGASKHSMSDISIFTSWDPGADNVTLDTGAGTTFTSQAVCNVKFKAFDSDGDECIVTLDGANYVPHQPHNMVAVGQLTGSIDKQ